MNKFIGIGNLTKDTELKYAAGNGMAIANFTIAIRRNFKNNGEYESDFINCVAFNKTAELLANYTSKGSKIGVYGRIQTRSYDNKEGKKVYVTEVVVDEVEFLSKSNKHENTNTNTKFEDVTEVVDGEDLPF